MQEDDPRFGAPALPFLQVPVVPVERMAFVAALVRDPAVDGQRLADVLDTGLVEFGDPGALGPDVAHAALDLGDCMLALYPVPPNADVSRSIWRGHYDRPRCIALALSVADQSVAEHALATEHVTVHHRSPDGRAVLVDGLPFPVVRTDRLLPGDPRRTDAP